MMEEKIDNIIPTIFIEMESDADNESDTLLRYFLRCNPQERAVVDKVLLYICGWTFATPWNCTTGPAATRSASTAWTPAALTGPRTCRRSSRTTSGPQTSAYKKRPWPA